MTSEIKKNAKSGNIGTAFAKDASHAHVHGELWAKGIVQSALTEGQEIVTSSTLKKNEINSDNGGRVLAEGEAVKACLLRMARAEERVLGANSLKGREVARRSPLQRLCPQVPILIAAHVLQHACSPTHNEAHPTPCPLNRLLTCKCAHLFSSPASPAARAHTSSGNLTPRLHVRRLSLVS